MANVSLDYKYYLTNVNWTNHYNDVLCFKDDLALTAKQNRNAYFDLENVFSGITDTFNFNITNLYKTICVIDSADYLTALQSNYLIVCKWNADATKREYFFYFITNVRQCNSNRVELNIELDLFQQYFYDVTFPKAPINRCKYPINQKHSSWTLISNRNWIDNTKTLPFNSEPIDFSQQYLKKIKVDEYARDYLNGFNQVNKIVVGWAYIFVDPSYQFECVGVDGQTIQHDFPGYTTGNGLISGNFNNIGVFCAPIYSGTTRLALSDGNDTIDISDAFVIIEGLKSGHSGADAGHIYSTKISRRPPLTYNFLTNYSCSYDNVNDKYIFTCNWYPASHVNYLYEPSTLSTASAIVGVKYVGSDYYGIRLIVDRTDNVYEYDYDADTDNFIGNSLYDPATKLITAQYRDCYVDFGDGNKMQFDFSKACNTDTVITMLYKEAITPDITRYVACFKNKTWYNGTNSDAIQIAGESFTADMSLIFTLDQWAEFLANNKNFYAQGNYNALLNYAKGGISAVAQAGALNYVGAAATVANTTLDTLAFVKNREYQVDNKKSAVDRVINQNGSAIFNLVVRGIIPEIEIYEILSDDKAKVTNYLKAYGVNTTGLFDNIKNYLSSESFDYAYMQADVHDIKVGTMPLECENRFLQIFKDGVRMWFDPDTMYDY